MAAANYPDPVLPITLKFEGGNVDDKRDPGGRTSRGVTQKRYDAYRDEHGQPRQDVYKMTTAELADIYRSGYWLAVGGPTLPSGTDLAVFDYGVNSGPSRAKKAFAAVAKKSPPDQVKAICASRMSMLKALNIFATYGRGWTTRVAAIEAAGVKMALLAASLAPHAPGVQAAVAAQLQSEGHKAEDKAAAASTGAKSAGAASVPAAAVTSAQFDWSTLILCVVVLAAIVGLCIWLAHKHGKRAEAYAAEARA